MTRRALSLVCLLIACFTITVIAQDKDKLDPIQKQTASLEAELSKLRFSTPEAAKIQLELIDVYHKHGRVFGVIRVGQKFVSLHTEHPRHKEVMLKLLDGLRAGARTREAIAIARQFLERHPKDAECAKIESWLARALHHFNERAEAAKVYEAIWKRQGNNEAGRAAAHDAITLLRSLNNKVSLTHAATLSEELLDKVGKGTYASQVGWQAVGCWERINDWAKANLAANKMLKKGLPIEKDRQQELHRRIGENYARLGQRTNAVASFQKALALGQRLDIHQRLITEMHHAQAMPPQMEPFVNQYVQKYPNRQDRHVMRSYLAHAYLRAKNNAKAFQIFAELVPHDARSNSNANALVGANGNEPAKLAQSEQILLKAAATNKRDAGYIRYVLAFNVYAPLKQMDKIEQTLKTMLTQSPTNDGHTHGAINWLLSNVKTDQEFQQRFNFIAQARKKWPHLSSARNYLTNWVKSFAKNNRNKELKDRVTWARQAIAKADADPTIQEWVAIERAKRNVAPKLRAKFLEPARFNNLTDEQARLVLDAQAYYYRHYSPSNERKVTADVYELMTKRFPKDFRAAYYFVETTTNWGPKEQQLAAVEHLLKQTPEWNNADLWRRLVGVADAKKDVALLKRVMAWISQSQKKFGFDPGYASYIGDVLEKQMLKDEAQAYWKLCLSSTSPNQSEYRACAQRIADRLMGAERTKFIQTHYAKDSDYHGAYAMWLADDALKAKDIDTFEKVLRETKARQAKRPFRNWGMEESPAYYWVTNTRNDPKADPAIKERVFQVVSELEISRPAALAMVAMLELPQKPDSKQTEMDRLQILHNATLRTLTSSTSWDWLYPYAQAAMTKKDYPKVASLVSNMLTNIPNIDAGRKKNGHGMISQAYSRLGAAGTSIDENSPIAPLVQAALQLRLGDENLAFETYLANKALFDKHRHEVPMDLLLFVCEKHIAAGGDENHERVEDILRSWQIKKADSKDVSDVDKAKVQLLLARNYFRARRYDLARAEYTTVVNRYGTTPQAIEAQFGIGETFMEQKVFDQAGNVFEKLAASKERDIVIRAEFLRGVLASRRGDRDEARDIFRSVLERVPTIELANQVLFNLSEVYAEEQRYIDQLELLRTIGRLGRNSKRWHNPGDALSIVVQDSDLGVSRGASKIPVVVTTKPGNDREVIFLRSGGAGKGLFRADLTTALGSVTKEDKVLQLTGKDTIRVDYTDDFKKEFKNVPLPDADIQIAANATFDVGSRRIVDESEQPFGKKLVDEGKEEEQLVSQQRPATQVKPGNLIYIRVKDADRDSSDEKDKVTVKLIAASGDQVQAELEETGSHTGIFEGTAKTGELPAGALATDTAIDHSPLMAIDRDKGTAWLSEPDGVTPKVLTVDMKELRTVDRVTISTPNVNEQAPVRGILEGSNDGRFWFKIASNPVEKVEPAAVEKFGPMTLRLFEVKRNTNYTTWQQVVSISKNGTPITEKKVDTLSHEIAETPADQPKRSTVALWHGKLVKARPGAARITVKGTTTAFMIDGRLELPVGNGGRSVDVWLDAGTHDLTVFAYQNWVAAGGTVDATWAPATTSAEAVTMRPFVATDFDLTQPAAKPAPERKLGTATVKDGTWDFTFQPHEIRHLRLVIQEYVGEAVAINHLEIHDTANNKIHVPTEADLLSLASNNVLEIAGGDEITATYLDENTPTGNSRLLSKTLTATYYNAQVNPIGYDFVKAGGGGVNTIRKELLRVDPGERFIVEVVDYDADQTNKPDKIKIQVMVNDGKPVELTATETGDSTGIFTKEVDTTDEAADGKLTVKMGDRIYCRYVDAQNTIPGHAVPRESVVLVNKPTDGQIRIVETRLIPPPKDAENATAKPVYLPLDAEKKIGGVAYGVPLTVVVIDPDSAKDSRSKVLVELVTSAGVKVEVECVLSTAMSQQTAGVSQTALEQGRFVGQVIMQLGGKESPDLVPVVEGMPRGLIGGAVLPKDVKPQTATVAQITRVLNLTGQDVVTAKYEDARRPENKSADLTSQARLITQGQLACTDADYKKNILALHVGEKLYLQVIDPDQDKSDESDRIEVEITTARGEKEKIELIETLAHTGVFAGSVALRPVEKPTVGNLKPENPILECWFGDKVMLTYRDKLSSNPESQLAELAIPIVVGTNGKITTFSKRFNNEELAVETQFHVAESHFELFKSHRALKRDEEAKADLEAGRRVLREVLEDFPNPKYRPRISYLLGQFSQELKRWDEAIESYKLIVKRYQDHPLAPDAQYKLAQCYEESGEFEAALEEYVALAATYPRSPLIANVMLRISEHFYKAENFQVSAQVGEKFLERFEGHKWSSKIAFRVGQCYFKDKQFRKSADAFDKFAKTFPDDPLASDSLFWAGESFRMAKNDREAFIRYNNCRWKHPSSESAKYARGRLALPEMLRQFEQAANDLDK